MKFTVTCSPGSFGILLCVFVLTGCASYTPNARSYRPFSFEQDTFAYPNELVWEYSFDGSGNWSSKRREPKPDYTHHCFVVARSTKQFFRNALFDPGQPKTNEVGYRRLVRRVVKNSAATEKSEQKKIIIPGYANLKEFSQAHEALLQQECGGAWQSYFQRGHWRMIMPFSRSQQEKMAARLKREIEQNMAPVVHVMRFPQLSINHAVVFFGVTEKEKEMEFKAYDPNQPEKPIVIIFDNGSRTFFFPRTDYFVGGKVNAYEVYRSAFY